MMKCLYLLSVVFQVAAGCSLSAVTKTQGYKGGSVLLPCSCSDLHSKPEKLTWWSDSRNINLTRVLNDEHYSGRYQLFNNTSPANLSLLISDLREDDQGYYRCSIEKEYRDIWLNVKGCSLSAVTKTQGYKGGSVLLPCSCSDLHSKPEKLTWWSDSRNINLTRVLNDEHYSGRYQLFNNTSPANLSLLISDLREEDQGYYRCSIEKEYRDIWLNVKGCSLSAVTKTQGYKGGSVLLPCSCSDLNSKPQKLTWWSDSRNRTLTKVLNDEHFNGRYQLFNNISPANMSLLISDLREEDQGNYRCSIEKEYRDIWLYVKGCELVKKTVVENVTGLIGESVVLPCICTDLQNDPKRVTWKFYKNNSFQEIYPKQTGNHSNRVKLVSKNPPGNLSLLILDLTEEDQGIYRCSAQADHRDLRLSVKGGRRSGESIITEGHPGRKGNQKDQTVPDVTYSTVSHINTAGEAQVQIKDGEKTEYASIITN
ncbi:hypothetical protein C0J50_6601 [Silurus asotus]|uniref:Ig-like domain-containing protein n=1 Tax=Silurus asotus TaxID=30991 RepID=A0AAD5A2E0_SILAS|nr:hypothetical protein C0J50_6601 [Silurus asotus]